MSINGYPEILVDIDSAMIDHWFGEPENELLNDVRYRIGYLTLTDPILLSQNYKIVVQK